MPGRSSVELAVLRPLSGSDCTVLPEMTSPTVVVSVCRIGDAPSTCDRLLELTDRHLEVEARDLLRFERDGIRSWPCGSPSAPP